MARQYKVEITAPPNNSEFYVHDNDNIEAIVHPDIISPDDISCQVAMTHTIVCYCRTHKATKIEITKVP